MKAKGKKLEQEEFAATIYTGPIWLGIRESTTGFGFFAEYLRHSAKAKLYSAKPLSSAALGKEHTAKN